MKYILVGTNRSGSRSKQLGLFIQKLFTQAGESVEIIDLAELPLEDLKGGYGSIPAGKLGEALKKIEEAEALYIVVPEYNGSMPGALKYFIDFWKYPEAFEARPVAFIGLGGMFGGMRPVEHLQQVFGYRNAYIFPQRLFLQNVWTQLKEGEIKDPTLLQLMTDQVRGFQKFVRALQSEGLDANTLNKTRKK